MAKNYDIMNGGLEQLVKDLDDYKNYLTYANMQLVSELSNMAKSDILANSSRAYETEQQVDIFSKTNVVQGKRGKRVSSDRIVNPSDKAAFAEFGYGIIGANSKYAHMDFLNPYAIGWYGYDVHTTSKRADGSWYYKDAYGHKHHTYGATPRNIFYNAGMKVIKVFPLFAYRIFNRWK